MPIDRSSPRPMTRGAAIAATLRDALTEIEVQLVGGFLYLSEKAGRDIRLDRDAMDGNGEQLQELYAEGVVLLASQALQRRFIVIKLDQGAARFSHQNSRVATYVGNLHEDAFVPGPSFESLSPALHWVSSAYRALEGRPAT